MSDINGAEPVYGPVLAVFLWTLAQPIAILEEVGIISNPDEHLVCIPASVAHLGREIAGRAYAVAVILYPA